MSLPDVVVCKVHLLSTPNENFVSILVYDGQNPDHRQIFFIRDGFNAWIASEVTHTQLRTIN